MQNNPKNLGNETKLNSLPDCKSLKVCTEMLVVPQGHGAELRMTGLPSCLT